MFSVTKQTFLESANLVVDPEPVILRTVVGSSVAICVWDRQHRYGGMCNFICPEIHEEGKATVKYGNVAIYTLLKTMNNFGSNIKCLEAQIMGGAEPAEFSERRTYAKENIEMAHAAMKKYGVRITSTDTGGNMGRKIAFNTLKNEVFVHKVEKLRENDWNFIENDGE